MRHRAGRGGRGRTARCSRVRRRRIGHVGERRARRRRARSPEPRGVRPRQRRAARGLPAAARRACGRRPSPRALEGQGHDDRALGADGHRHSYGHADLSARLSVRRARPLHAPDGSRRPRQQAGFRYRDHRRAGRGASANREVDRLHLGRLRLPDRCSRRHDSARGALSGMRSRARDPDRQARGRARHRQAVRRRAWQLRAHA